MLIIARSFVSDFDGKIQKYFQALRESGVSFHFVGWTRGLYNTKCDENTTLYNKKGYVGGGVKSIFGVFFWNLFLFKVLLKNKRTIKAVHVIDFDSVIPALFFCAIFKKKFIFDIYDKFSDVRTIPVFLKQIIDFLEKFCLKKADLVILADEIRYEQHGLSRKADNIIILENVPQGNTCSNLKSRNLSGELNIGYFGVLEPEVRGLEDLVDAIENIPWVKLHVVGYGPLFEYFQIKSNELNNIFFYGPKTSEDGMEIMKDMDVLIGMYYRSVKNHLYAAPNKYYEHLKLGVPLITTKGTPPGFKVEQYNTGWSIREGKNSINKCLSTMRFEKSQIEIKASNACKLWNSRYINYYQSHYKGLYIDKIKEFMG